MKVKELIKWLKKQQQDAMILLSSDEEGNSYSPLDLRCGYSVGNFDAEKNSPLGVQNSIYSMDEEEMKGDYIILYPR